MRAEVDKYLAERHGEFSPATWNKHAMTLRKFCEDYNSSELQAITRDDLVAWRAGLGVRAASANQYMKRVRLFLQWAEDNDIVVRNVARGMKPLTEDAPRRVRLPAEAFQMMLTTARHPRDRALIATAIELLLRGGELARLRVGDFHGNSLIVHVEKKKGVFVEDEMAISDALSGSLTEWLGAYRRASGLIESASFLFPNVVVRRHGSRTDYHLRPQEPVAQPWAVVKLALVNAGLPVEPHTGFHAIRRTCARLLFDHLVEHHGADRALGHVSSLLHHESRKTTELYLGTTGDRALRNKFVKQHQLTPLVLSTTTVAKPEGSVSALSRV